ncbi:MAG: beta-ketoacyl-ACP synthase I [Rhodospirillaceae bacterium]|nr:beta-ketoacyl-ACP synthase I [Rhodospirillaceae bacterium]MBT5298472.1 beta-ketoacyl-ACP synthase I [Rhodospirillaceae bacterium]MBT6087748.1 beta-ketoacyl-ACP synthase I [Rhodospirillaceae bacterium]MBT6609820.1 beta-ketoacyl-ACP synthase I [Rhodospirillaceae bacterium]MBT6883215.1 beta-ketoacyl-ACP synthase I [Rhodospirillaceae bacterium]
MRRVVVTGMGIVSCIGNNKDEVLDSLKAGRSGISFSEEYAERGFRSHVHGAPQIDMDNFIDRKLRRFMGDGAAYNYVAMREAIADAGLEQTDVSNERTGLVMGSGGPSTSALVNAADTAREKSAKRVGPYAVPKAMCSTNSANLSTAFGMRGLSYSISSACATSAHCVGNGAELIQWGKQDVVFAGGGEEVHWTLTVLFDAMGALSSKFNDEPTRASRPFDAGRDGFVIAGGAGVVVLEELEHAKARGAKIYGEVVGYGATSDGVDMVAPSGEGGMRCMQMAIQGLGNTPVDYINAHGTSTPVGDTIEIKGIREVFGAHRPKITSTKSLTGHSQGATGVHEVIYSLIMLDNDFIAASANVETLDPDVGDADIVTERIDDAGLKCVLSNSFGFGGTNATLAFNRLEQ